MAEIKDEDRAAWGLISTLRARENPRAPEELREAYANDDWRRVRATVAELIYIREHEFPNRGEDDPDMRLLRKSAQWQP